MIHALTVALFLSQAQPAATDFKEVDTATPGFRVIGTMTGALVASVAVAATTAAAYFSVLGVAALAQDYSGASTFPSFIVAAIAGGAALFTMVPLGAWIGQRLAGGRATYAATVVGCVLGSIASATLAVVAIWRAQQGDTAGEATASIFAAAAFFSGPLIATELSHDAQVSPWPHVGVAPTKGGGALALSWAL